MKEIKEIRIKGFFSVRQYKKGVPRNEQSILDEGSQIAFIANLPAEPSQDESDQIKAVRQYGTPYTITKDDGTVINKLRLKFKIGTYCQWAHKDGIDLKNGKLPNEYLDGKRFDAVIKYVYKEKKSDNQLSPSGMWCNTIAIKELVQNAFENDPFADDDDNDMSHLSPTVNPEPAQYAAPVTNDQATGDGDIPF